TPSCSLSVTFSFSSCSYSSATSSRKASTSCGSKPRNVRTVNCCCRMSRGLRRIGTLQVSADLQCHRETVADRHEEVFEEVKGENHDHRGEGEPHRQRRQAVTDRPQDRLGRAVQEAHDRIVRIRVDPREKRPGDNEPDEHDDDEGHQIGDSAQKVRPDEHRRSLTPPALPRPRSFERCVARSTALMNVVRTPPSSSAATPAIDVPPGLDTMSLRAPGCRRVSRSSLAAPRTVWVASVIAVARSSPILTPPSASDSITSATYAGPEPARPVTAPLTDSSSTA